MKHLRPFNENKEKELINWKIVSFITEQLTKYEDDDYILIIGVYYEYPEQTLSSGKYLTVAWYVYDTRKDRVPSSRYNDTKGINIQPDELLYSVSLYKNPSNPGDNIGSIDMTSEIENISKLLSRKLELYDCHKEPILKAVGYHTTQKEKISKVYYKPKSGVEL